MFVFQRTKMTGRDDVALAAALEAMANVVGNQNNAGGNDGTRMLDRKSVV